MGLKSFKGGRSKIIHQIMYSIFPNFIEAACCKGILDVQTRIKHLTDISFTCSYLVHGGYKKIQIRVGVPFHSCWVTLPCQTMPEDRLRGCVPGTHWLFDFVFYKFYVLIIFTLQGI